MKIGFHLLVNTFCFAIRLRVIHSGKGKVIVEELAKFFGKGRGELWAMIGDDFVVEPETEVYFVKEEGGYPFSGDRFLSRAENYSLRKAMVDHDQQGIKARGGGEVGDQVARDLLEGARGVGLNRGEQGDGGMHVRLVLLAYGAAFDILSHKLCKTQPPKLHGDELASFEVAGVSSSFVVVAVGKDGATKGVVGGNIDMTFVGQNMVVKLPIREMGMEDGVDVLQGRL